MKTILNFTLLASLCFSFLFSCTPEIIPPDDCVYHALKSESGQLLKDFTFNNDKLLEEENLYSANGDVGIHTTYSYDGILAISKTVVDEYGTKQGCYTDEINYENDLIVSVNHFYGSDFECASGELYATTIYTYDSNGALESTVQEKVDDFTILGYDKIDNEYDNNENVSHSDYWSEGDIVGTSNYTYEDKSSLFKGTYLYNPNILKEERHDNITFQSTHENTYIYTFYENGLIESYMRFDQNGDTSGFRYSIVCE